jgi:hypothetical protein
MQPRAQALGLQPNCESPEGAKETHPEQKVERCKTSVKLRRLAGSEARCRIPSEAEGPQTVQNSRQAPISLQLHPTPCFQPEYKVPKYGTITPSNLLL